MNKILYSLPAAIKLQNVMQDLLSSNIQNNLKFEKIYFNQSIEIKNLQFSYNKNKKIISKDFVQFNKNQKYLIQGRSGSGKTTFIELLLGFKKPDEGEFFADSVPYYPVQQPKWKSLFGYVPQEIYLLNETVSSNIAFGEYSNDIDYLKIKKILNTMNLDKVLDLNYKIENYGSNISGGQKQRLGICRALYFNPDILVLDEPTSSLNSEDSLKIMKDILGLNKTIIVVSHDTNITSFFKNIINFK